jgi:hypothetical protein
MDAGRTLSSTDLHEISSGAVEGGSGKLVTNAAVVDQLHYALASTNSSS